MEHHPSYDLYFRFLEAFLPGGFLTVDTSSPLVRELEKLSEANNQYFYVADLLKFQILFVSSRSRQMLGREPSEVEPGYFFKATHPEDQHRLSLGRTRLFTLGQEIFMKKEGIAVMSHCFRTRHVTPDYVKRLIQGYIFYSGVPSPNVYLLQVVTDITSWYRGETIYHHYVGEDLSCFRLPDEALLGMGDNLTKRETEIIQMISRGLSSKQISEHLFLSVHTINTHRRNILKKTGKMSTADLLHDLSRKGML